MSQKTTVEFSRDEGESWKTWAFFENGSHVKAYQTCARLRKLYPEWIFRVVKPKGTK